MLLGNLPLPRLTIDELRQWEGPSIDDEIFAQFSVWLESAGDAATIAGIKRDAVRVAEQRLGTFPYKYLLYENVPNLCSATYQVASAGRSRQRAVFDRRRIADPKVWLTERLGPLAYFAETEAEQPVAETQPATEPITAPLAADCPSDGIDWDTTLRSLAVGSAPDGGLIPHTTGPASDALICAGIGDDAEDTAPPFEPAELPPASVRRCGWFVDTTGDVFRKCDEPIADGLELCPAHRQQRAAILLGDYVRPPMPFPPHPTGYMPSEDANVA